MSAFMIGVQKKFTRLWLSGGDPFGGQTFERPWFGDTLERTITVVPAPPAIAGAFSRREHDEAGPFDLDLLDRLIVLAEGESGLEPSPGQDRR